MLYSTRWHVFELGLLVFLLVEISCDLTASLTLTCQFATLRADPRSFWSLLPNDIVQLIRNYAAGFELGARDTAPSIAFLPAVEASEDDGTGCSAESERARMHANSALPLMYLARVRWIVD